MFASFDKRLVHLPAIYRRRVDFFLLACSDHLDVTPRLGGGGAAGGASWANVEQRCPHLPSPAVNHRDPRCAAAWRYLRETLRFRGSSCRTRTCDPVVNSHLRSSRTPWLQLQDANLRPGG